MRSMIAGALDRLCSKTHWMHRLYLPWLPRRIHNLLYGCPLATLALRIDGSTADATRNQGTPWGYPARRIDHDNPWNDGMDFWGDPTDQDWRDTRHDAAEYCPSFEDLVLDVVYRCPS